MFHARQLVDLIHKCSEALCEWQKQTTGYLLDRFMAATYPAEDERRLVEIFREIPNDASLTGECEDCRKAKRLAWSDMTTPGFFHPYCERHAPKADASQT